MKHKVIKQINQKDCGPACLLTILNYYGGSKKLEVVREYCKTSAHGTNMFGLVKGAEKLGFKAFGATGTYDELMKQKMPCIAHVVLENGLHHYLVIFKISANKVLIGDPAKGKYTLEREEFEKIWVKKAVVLLEPDKSLPDETELDWKKWIWEILTKNENWTLQIVFLGVLYSILGLASAVFMKIIIDKYLNKMFDYNLIFVILILHIFLLIKSIFGYIRGLFVVKLNKNVAIEINNDFLKKIFILPQLYFDNRKVGDITARINDGIKVQQFILQLTSQVILDFLLIISSFGLILYYIPSLALLLLFILPVFVAIIYMKIKKIDNLQKEVMHFHSVVESTYIDSLNGISDILTFKAEKYFRLLNKNVFERFQEQIEKLGKVKIFLSYLYENVGTFITVIFLGYGSYLITSGKHTLGEFMAIFSLISSFLPTIVRQVETFVVMKGAEISALRLKEIVDYPIKSINENVQENIQKLEITDGFFEWTYGQPLLYSINIKVEKGKIIGLIGPSGSGKTTLAKILQGKYPLTGGKFKINDKIVINPDMYSKFIGVIPQQVKIFNLSIVDNVLLGREAYNEKSWYEKLKQYDLENFIDRFNAKQFSLLGEEGVQLSGGEKQVIGFLRAIWQNPDILIVDEGLSALDGDLKKMIQRNLEMYAKNNGVVIITHNYEDLKKVDEVYIIQNSKTAKINDINYLLSGRLGNYERILNDKAIK